MFGSLQDNLRSNRPTTYAALAIAIWLVYLEGKSQSGQQLPIDDSNWGEISQKKDPGAILDMILPSNEVFVSYKQQTLEKYQDIKSNGLRKTLRKHLESQSPG